MIDEVKIQSLLSEISEKLKAAYSGKDGKESPHEKAEWGKLYKKAYEHSEEIEVHACGDFPHKLIDYTFPNETKEEKDYRNKSFQPVTKPYWKKAVKSLNRIWAEQNYRIEWNDEKVDEYFTQDLPLYNDIRHYFKSVVTSAKINDPNGVLAVVFDVPTKETEEGIVVDDSKEINPYPAIFESEDVIQYKENDYCLLVSDEKSVVKYAGKSQAKGYVFYLYDKNTIYKIYQIGDLVDWKFEATTYYEHGLEWLPCWKLKGTPEDVIDSTVYYESHFAPAIPHLNEAVILHSTLKASISKVAYPIRSYYEQECNACTNGIVVTGEGETLTSSKCSSCGGTGKMKFSPLRDYVHKLPTATDPEAVPFPGLTYVSPDNAILEFSSDKIDDYISKAFLFLNIDAIPNGMKAGLGQDATATKSKIDREEQFVSMLDISNELFELLDYFLYAAYRIKWMASDSIIKISPPKTFELTSAAELTDELSQAKTNAIPDIAIGALTTDYVTKRFTQNGKIADITKVVQYCDALYTKDEQSIALLRPTLQTWEIILHTFIYTFIYEKLNDNPDYLSKPVNEIKAELVEMAKAKAAELPNGQNTASSLISQIATTA